MALATSARRDEIRSGYFRRTASAQRRPTNLSGLSSPAGLGLDANGNLYVADSGNKQVLFSNRQNPMVPFGTVPEDLASPSGVAGTPVGCPVAGSSQPCTGVLTVTNIGNQPVTLSSPFLSGTGNPAFAISTTCTSPMPVGTSCKISPTFNPSTGGASNANVTVAFVAGFDREQVQPAGTA